MKQAFDWRASLAQLALITLALSAAYGVYRFQAHFTPEWVALVSAASFELTYIGLAVLQTTPATRKRATAISIGAVVVSVVYNSLSALFDIRPALLDNPALWVHAALAVLHGMPLAFVAFLVSDLLLHTAPGMPAPAFTASRVAEQVTYPMPKKTRIHATPESINAAPLVCPKCSTTLDAPRWRAARRWGHCANCKEMR